MVEVAWGASPEGAFHVSPHRRGWSVGRRAAGRASRVFRAKRDALRYAERRGRPVVLHTRNGMILVVIP